MGAPSCTCPWVYMAPSDAPSVPQPVENGPKTVQRQAEAAKRYPKTVQRGKMLAEAANRYPKTVKWGKLSGFGQVLGKMLAEAAKRYPKTVPASGSGKRWAKVTRKQSDGEKC